MTLVADGNHGLLTPPAVSGPQVYIVAVQRQGDAPGPEDPTNEDSGAVSRRADLLKLVQSDLPTLSRLWLSALQDYATLTLPPEDAAQRPAAGRRGWDRVTVVTG